MVLILAGMIPFVFLVAWYLGRWCLSRHYCRLLDIIRDIRHGQLEEIKTALGRGTLVELAQEFNCLFAAWKTSQNELQNTPALVERKVIHRTEELQRANRRLQKNANTDGLTGLANRAYFKAYLDILFRQVCDDHADLACLMMDVDKFKAVNDHLGHAAGDDLIVFIGELLKACTREGDVSGRYGGDEFVVLLQEVSSKEAYEIAERIRLLFQREAGRFQVVKSSIPPHPPEVIIPHLSIGLATRKKNHPHDPLELIRMADEALYQAKNAGRNQVVVYENLKPRLSGK